MRQTNPASLDILKQSNIPINSHLSAELPVVCIIIVVDTLYGFRNIYEFPVADSYEHWLYHIYCIALN